MDISNYKLIFHFLDAICILRCGQVCRQWKQFAQSDEIWREQTRQRSYANCSRYYFRIQAKAKKSPYSWLAIWNIMGFLQQSCTNSEDFQVALSLLSQVNEPEIIQLLGSMFEPYMKCHTRKYNCDQQLFIDNKMKILITELCKFRLKFHGKYANINDNCLFLRGLRSIIEETNLPLFSTKTIRIRTIACVSMVSLLTYSLSLEYFKPHLCAQNGYKNQVDQNVVLMYLNVPSALRNTMTNLTVGIRKLHENFASDIKRSPLYNIFLDYVNNIGIGNVINLLLNDHDLESSFDLIKTELCVDNIIGLSKIACLENNPIPKMWALLQFVDNKEIIDFVKSNVEAKEVLIDTIIKFNSVQVNSNIFERLQDNLYVIGQYYINTLKNIVDTYMFYPNSMKNKMDEYLQQKTTNYNEGTLWTLYGLLDTKLISKTVTLNWLQKFDFKFPKKVNNLSTEIRSLFLKYFLPESTQPTSIYWLLEGYLSGISTSIKDRYKDLGYTWETSMLNSIKKQIELLNIPHTKWIEKKGFMHKPFIMMLQTFDSYITIDLSRVGKTASINDSPQQSIIDKYKSNINTESKNKISAMPNLKIETIVAILEYYGIYVIKKEEKSIVLEEHGFYHKYSPTYRYHYIKTVEEYLFIDN